MTDPSESNGRVARPRSRRRWVLSCFLAAAIFVSGMATGGALTTYLMFRHRMAIMENIGDMPRRLAVRMRKDLDLTDEQSQEIEAVLTRHHKELMALRAKVQPRVMEKLEDFRAEITAILTPEQAEEWNEKFTRMQERFMPPSPPPFVGPPSPPHE